MDRNTMFDLGGQVAFVTGAAKGLGLAMAEIVAQSGARVVMTDIDPDALTASVERLAGQGLDVRGEIVDVADTDRLARAINDAARRLGRLDVVFANAGISAGPGPLTDAGSLAQVDLDRWNRLLQINLTSVFVTIRTAAAQMIKQRSGRLIVTASVAGLRGERMCGYAYAATKAAVSNLVRQSSIELSPHNVTINAIAPGPFLTDIGQGRLHDPEVAAGFTRDVPMGRLGQPDEIKGLALLLASPASSYITGAVIPVDGGASAS
ncbi:SDR family NAD(P)-dependent oxidoreductase [Bradyrhizobium sp. AS23.2]|uniref:SDR family NAD(P)-dependent oxidoreductase n=1 Tax=Bradyrhizobium sp. AS23.2 TaxID=1680155 RepID=UPI00093EB1FA|nr:SDR family NAD(P)-dependent oxidoreductase [Bradyrhizobium sp. AS23.2]OKO77034.1 short-chain dehydrogenase [Bradyrhizobium sp. AS23.2]